MVRFNKQPHEKRKAGSRTKSGSGSTNNLMLREPNDSTTKTGSGSTNNLTIREQTVKTGSKIKKLVRREKQFQEPSLVQVQQTT